MRGRGGAFEFIDRVKAVARTVDARMRQTHTRTPCHPEPRRRPRDLSEEPRVMPARKRESQATPPTAKPSGPASCLRENVNRRPRLPQRKTEDLRRDPSTALRRLGMTRIADLAFPLRFQAFSKRRRRTPACAPTLPGSHVIPSRADGRGISPRNPASCLRENVNRRPRLPQRKTFRTRVRDPSTALRRLGMTRIADLAFPLRFQAFSKRRRRTPACAPTLPGSHVIPSRADGRGISPRNSVSCLREA